MHLRKSRVLKKIKEGGCAFSFKMNVVDPRIAEIAAMSGIDCIWIDMEHTHLSYRDVLTHISTCRAAGVSSLVRVPQNDLTATKKVLEMGPDGILFPMVRSAKEVKELIHQLVEEAKSRRRFRFGEFDSVSDDFDDNMGMDA